MSAPALREEIARQASRPWRSHSRLVVHVQRHQDEFRVAYGRPFGADAVDALASEITTAPDRVYTELTGRGTEWYFIRSLSNDSAMIVIVRDGWRRSVYLAEPFSRWLSRHAAAIEVHV